MALSTEDLTEIETLLSAADAERSAFGVLRQRFPNLSFTRCDASDVVETPFRSFGRFDIHLLDTADHCAHITTDIERATGLILALRSRST